MVTRFAIIQGAAKASAKMATTPRRKAPLQDHSMNHHLPGDQFICS